MDTLATPYAVTASPMTPADLKEVLDIEAHSFYYPWSSEMFMGEIANNSAHPIVFRRSGKILGYVCVWFITDEAHLHNIAVRPKMRGKGLGLDFLCYVEDLAKQKKMRRIVLDVARGNKPARNLYLKAGFRSIGFRKNYYADTGDDALIMEKLLK